MRAIYILPILLIIVINGCTTIEVAKEVTKVTKIVKTTIDEITNAQDEINEDKADELEVLIKEKEEVVIERKKEEAVAIKQKNIVPIKFLGKTLNQLTQELGKPVLVREDGNTRTVRFDTLSCRLFVYFDLTVNKSRAEYYEIRNTIGALIDRKENIEKCLQEISQV